MGVHKRFQGQSAMQLGLALSTTGNAHLQGVIWDDASPLFDNHKYQYKVRNSHTALKGKFVFNNIWMINPWVSATAGVGFNRAHSFKFTGECFIEEPCAGKPPARFCGGWHSLEILTIVKRSK